MDSFNVDVEVPYTGLNGQANLEAQKVRLRQVSQTPVR